MIFYYILILVNNIEYTAWDPVWDDHIHIPVNGATSVTFEVRACADVVFCLSEEVLAHHECFQSDSYTLHVGAEGRN